MPRFAANLSTLYPEHDFLDRFAAAAADDFTAVECQFPYDVDRHVLAARLADHGLEQVLFNAPPGDLDAGERGLACLPHRVDAFRRSLHDALRYATALHCPRVHVMAGIAPAGVERARLRAIYLDNMRWAAAEAATCGVDLMIEPINPRDVPGFFLSRQDEAHAIVVELRVPNVKVQMDLYHCQIVEGDLATKLREFLATGRVGHLQIAGVPDRQEPDRGEIDFGFLFDVIDELGFDGWVGCEYRPRGATSKGLGWLRRWRRTVARRRA